MASELKLFNSYNFVTKNGTVDLDTDPIKVALLTSGYAFNANHTVFADLSAHEGAAGNGYTLGGVTLTGQSVTIVGGVTVFTADAVAWLLLTKTFRWAVLYADKTANGMTKPLLGIALPDNTPADVSVVASDYALMWNANGIARSSVV